MLKYLKSAPYLPDLQRARPVITDDDRARAALDPPAPVPFHCKPWVDAQTLGWVITFGFLTDVTIVAEQNGSLSIENGSELARETLQPDLIDQFANRHFGIGCGYSLLTPPGFGALLLPVSGTPDGLVLVPGFVETDWYPRQLFLVYAAPPAGTRIFLTRGTPLGRAAVVPRHEGAEAEILDKEELAAYETRRDVYLAEEQSTPRWTADNGRQFTHLYKIWSARQREQRKRGEVE